MTVAMIPLCVRLASIASVAFGLSLTGTEARAADSSGNPTRCAKAINCRELVPMPGGILQPVYASLPFTRGDPRIVRVVIIVHGTNRNGGGYFATGMAAALRANVGDETLVVAPVFSIEKDRKDRAPNELYWPGNTGWKEGGASAVVASSQIGSFVVVDELIARLGDRTLFPNLTSIVIAGHSAGGQFVQRYAAGQSPDAVPAHVAIRYVVANPSSYLYFDKERPAAGGGFAVPMPAAACRYHRYKYGLEDRNPYMARADGATLRNRYRERDVSYLLGERDTDPNDPDLDKTCAGMLQGANRLERGKAFMAYMDRFMAPHRHRLSLVPGAGHSRTAMFTSAAGLEALFR